MVLSLPEILRQDKRNPLSWMQSFYRWINLPRQLLAIIIIYLMCEYSWWWRGKSEKENKYSALDELETRKAAWSVLILCCLILFIGYLFDVFGSYQVSLIVCGIVVICLGVNILADPLHERWQNRLDKQKDGHLRSPEDKHVYVYNVGAKSRSNVTKIILIFY